MNKCRMPFCLACAAVVAAACFVSGLKTQCLCRASLCTEAVPDAKGPAVRHVVLVGVDGLGANNVPWDRMPNLSKLRDEGLYAVSRCHRPTASAINWASVFTGLPPELHGYSNWDSQKPEIPPFKAVSESGLSMDIYRLVRERHPEAVTGSFFTWDGIGFVHASNTASVAKFVTGDDSIERNGFSADIAIEFLKEKKPELLFIYQGQVDHLGHANGWGSEEYTNACVSVDANIARVLEAIETAGLSGDTVVMLVADHGGKGKGHGGIEDILVFETPFVAWGAPLKGMRVREPVLGMDAAPTVLSLLGIDIPETMRGRFALAR